MSELDKIDRLISKPEAPERIHGWQHTQLSIARFHGGCKFQGFYYYISENEEGQPLVRADVFESEQKAAKLAEKIKRQEEKAAAIVAKKAQGALL